MNNDPDKAYDEWRQQFADEGKCHFCEGTGEVWELGPGYDGEEDVIPVPCPRCGKKEYVKTIRGRAKPMARHDVNHLLTSWRR